MSVGTSTGANIYMCNCKKSIQSSTQYSDTVKRISTYSWQGLVCASTRSVGPRCSDIATPNQTPTRGRRVLLLRLAKNDLHGTGRGPTRKEGIMWRSRARARGAGNPRPPLPPWGNKQRPSPGAAGNHCQLSILLDWIHLSFHWLNHLLTHL